MFGTLKDDSLLIDSLALENNFSWRNVFQNGVNSLSKMVMNTPFFVKKLKISCSMDHAILFKFQWDMVETFFMESKERL